MSGKYVPEISNIFQHQEQENRNTRGHKDMGSKLGSHIRDEVLLS
jgi:hypothetical protein